MIVLLEEVLMQLLLWEWKIINGIIEIFNISKRLDVFKYQDEEINVYDYFLQNSIIEHIFKTIFIISIFMLGFFTIFALIKNMIFNQTTPRKIVTKFFLAIFTSVIMIIIVLFVLIFSNLMLDVIIDVINVDYSFNLCKEIFNNSVGEWLNDYSINEINLNSIVVRDLLGDYQMFNDKLWPQGWLNNGIINPNNFRFLEALLVTTSALIALGSIIYSLVKRIYEIILLYIMMPLSISTIPIDDGLRLKRWSELFCYKIIIVFGVVLSINLFLFILPVITNMTLNNSEPSIDSLLKLILIFSSCLAFMYGPKIFVHVLAKFRGEHTCINIKSNDNVNIDNSNYSNHRYYESTSNYGGKL